MNRIIGTLCLLISFIAKGQYYYKDITVSKQTAATASKYKNQGIRSVEVVSFENNGERTEDFTGTQTITSDYTRIVTTFKTPMSGESELTAFYDTQGRLLKTIDTADGSHSGSQYLYNTNGSLSKIANTSVSAGQKTEQEDHLYFYNANGQPERMLRVKNGADTTYVTFVIDENGNVTEENSIRRRDSLPSFYYYYDNKNRLTDIVTYNVKARRLLPLYIFEYTDRDEIKSMLVVPEGTDNYQKWVYEYNQAGLKIKETAFNKKRQVLGKIEYLYK